MIREIDPDYYSPAFFTPHPGTDLYDYCVEHDLSLITGLRQLPAQPDRAEDQGPGLRVPALGARSQPEAQVQQSWRGARPGLSCVSTATRANYVRKLRKLTGTYRDEPGPDRLAAGRRADGERVKGAVLVGALEDKAYLCEYYWPVLNPTCGRRASTSRWGWATWRVLREHGHAVAIYDAAIEDEPLETVVRRGGYELLGITAPTPADPRCLEHGQGGQAPGHDHRAGRPAPDADARGIAGAGPPRGRLRHPGRGRREHHRVCRCPGGPAAAGGRARALLAAQRRRLWSTRPPAWCPTWIAIPYPAHDLYKISRYTNLQPLTDGLDKQARAYTIMTSRGCPYKCTYCSKPITGNTWRPRSVAERDRRVALAGAGPAGHRDRPDRRHLEPQAGPGQGPVPGADRRWAQHGALGHRPRHEGQPCRCRAVPADESRRLQAGRLRRGERRPAHPARCDQEEPDPGAWCAMPSAGRTRPGCRPWASSSSACRTRPKRPWRRPSAWRWSWTPTWPHFMLATPYPGTEMYDVIKQRRQRLRRQLGGLCHPVRQGPASPCPATIPIWWCASGKRRTGASTSTGPSGSGRRSRRRASGPSCPAPWPTPGVSSCPQQARLRPDTIHWARSAASLRLELTRASVLHRPRDRQRATGHPADLQRAQAGRPPHQPGGRHRRRSAGGRCAGCGPTWSATPSTPARTATTWSSTGRSRRSCRSSRSLAARTRPSSPR